MSKTTMVRLVIVQSYNGVFDTDMALEEPTVFPGGISLLPRTGIVVNQETLRLLRDAVLKKAGKEGKYDDIVTEIVNDVFHVHQVFNFEEGCIGDSMQNSNSLSDCPMVVVIPHNLVAWYIKNPENYADKYWWKVVNGEVDSGAPARISARLHN
jgi:hypothetical protein